MITGIILRGFRAHVDSEIPLVPGLNVITGPSDSGKTAVLDAVKWTVYNEPTGEAYVNKGVGSAEVVITLDSGESVTKRRKGKKTSYQVSTIAEPFEKSEVPQEVTELLGISKQQFGDYTASLNFAYQLEAPFILSETASVGAKILGKIAGTEAVDIAIKGVSKDIHGQRNNRTAAEKDIEKINTQLESYNYLELALQKQEKVDELLSDIDLRVSKHSLLRNLLNTYSNNKTAVDQAQNKLKSLYYVLEAVQTMPGLEKRVNQLKNLNALNSMQQASEKKLEVAKASINKNQGARVAAEVLTTATTNVKAVEKLTALRDLHKRTTNSLSEIHIVFEKYRSLVPEVVNAIVNAQGDYSKAKHLKNLHQRYYGHKELHEKSKARASSIDLSNVPEIVSGIENDVLKLKSLRELAQTYTKNVSSVSVAAQEVDKGIKLLEESKTALEGLWEGLTVCPVCEQPVENH